MPAGAGGAFQPMPPAAELSLGSQAARGQSRGRPPGPQGTPDSRMPTMPVGMDPLSRKSPEAPRSLCTQVADPGPGEEGRPWGEGLSARPL